MIDENKDYDTKSKFRITVKILSKYNNRSQVAANIPEEKNMQIP